LNSSILSRSFQVILFGLPFERDGSAISFDFLSEFEEFGKIIPVDESLSAPNVFFF